MRTRILRDFPALPEEFLRDIETLWRLSDEQRSRLVPAAVRMLSAETNLQVDAIREETLAEIGGSQPDLLRSLNVLRYLGTRWNPYRDTPEGFVADLKSLLLLPPGKEDVATAFLLELFSAFQNDNLRRTTKWYANSLLPSYADCETLVDFRPVFDHAFGSLRDERIEDYRPDCIGWVPVILVKITRDSGQPTELEFQCEERDVRTIVDRLTAALRDLDSAKTFLALEEE